MGQVCPAASISIFHVGLTSTQGPRCMAVPQREGFRRCPPSREESSDQLIRVTI